MTTLCALILTTTLLACPRPSRIKTVPVEEVRGEYVLPGSPCKYQGTYVREMRFQIDQELSKKRITHDQWICQARALERMDDALEAACDGGEKKVPEVFSDARRDFDVCLTDPG